MEEYLSYSLSAQGLLFPVISIRKPGARQGDVVYRDMGREDLLRILDSANAPGGWLYKRSTASTASGTLSAWTRRFALLRGSYIFFFHNSQSEKPLFLVPLVGSDVVLPPNDAKAFDDTMQRRVFKANEGYEFEIKAPSIGGTSFPTVRLYTLFEVEREEWVNAIRERSQYDNDIAHEIPISPNESSDDPSISGVGMSSGRVILTRTKLSGLSPVANELINSAELNAQKLYIDASIPSTTRMPMTSISGNIATYSPFATPGFGGSFGQSLRDDMLDGNASDASGLREEDFVSRRVSVSIAELMPANDEDEEYEDLTPVDAATMERLMIRKQAKTRQMAAKERASSRQSIDAARAVETMNPMNFAEIFRVLLFFVKEELVEAPRPEVALQIPHLKGEWSENLVISIYQYYCGDNGYMTLEQFIEFMDDSGILQTHAPRDDNDEPNAEFERQLDPVELMTTLPPDLGFSAGMAEPLSINFFMFYQMILRITRIVYKDICDVNETHAMNKLIFESLCPLYAWCKGHSKRGSTDVLVLEDRIPLLLLTYSPNLWRVFLLYAQDVVGKTASVSSAAFPEEAQANEKGMHGLLPGIPYRVKSKPQESLFVTETSALRFASDYALIPHLLEKTEMRKLFAITNRAKKIIATKLSEKDQAPTHAALLRLEAVQDRMRTREAIENSKIYTFQPDLSKNLLHPNNLSPSSKKANGNTNAALLKVTGSSHAINNANNKGLSFSEFVEFIARIALNGMDQDAYNILFPTPFSKVLAVLTVWGVADLKKVEELRVLQTTKVA